MYNLLKLTLFVSITLLSACVGDDLVQDFVEPEVRLTTTLPSTLAVGEQLQLEAVYFNNVGQQVEAVFAYESSDLEIATVDELGVVSAISKGQTMLTITAIIEGIETASEHILTVDEETTVVEPMSIGGTIVTTSSYVLGGDFVLEEIDGGVRILIAENYVASTALPGLYIYLTNNKNTNVGALEIGRVTVFEGAHSYDVQGVTVTDFSHILYYCKPFSVKVGDGTIN